jgi:hypothetical protein
MAYTDIDDPTAYFQSNLHTGNSGTNALTFSGNSDLQPDWIWIKERGATGSHVLTDTVRGITKQIYSNDTQAENTNSSSVTAIGSNGFTLGNRADVNNNLILMYLGTGKLEHLCLEILQEVVQLKLILVL